MVAPRIRAGLDRDEAVAAVGAGEAAPGAGEVRVERRRMLVDLVPVAARRRSPARPRRARCAIGRPSSSSTRPRDDDPLAERLAVVLPASGRRRARSIASSPKTGPVERVELLRQRDERPLRRAQPRRAVARGSRPGPRGRSSGRRAARSRVVVGHAVLRLERAQRRRARPSVGGSVSRRSSATRSCQPVARAHVVDRRRPDARDVSVSSPSRGSRIAEVGDDDAHARRRGSS